MVDNAQPFRIHDWVVHPSLNRVECGGRSVPLEPRVMQVLVCLADRGGEVVTRGELLDAVWADVVVGEESLTGAISELRRILGDDARSPRYIETIRKGGYRLVAPAVPLEASAAGADAGGVGRPAMLRVVGAIALLGLVAVLAWVTRGLRAPREVDSVGSPLPLQATPFTSYPGFERMPAVSPDGTRIAFAWTGSEEWDSESSYEIDIYVKQPNAEVPLRLTDHPSAELNPAWSPDGASISYYNLDDEGAAIYLVPSVGGEPRRLITAPGLKGKHSWSPDGTKIVYAEAKGLFVRDLETGSNTRLTVPPVSCCGDKEPVFSPSGDRVAFVRIDGAQLEDLFVVAAAGGESRRISRGLLRMQGFDWTRDGRSIVVSSIRNGSYALWRVDVDDGSLTPVPTRGDWAVFPSIARRADRMAYTDVQLEANIWRTEPRGEADSGSVSRALISSTRADVEAAYSHDGDRVAFTSGRSGSMELWVSSADGSGPLQLTSFGGVTVNGPCWSPDGSTIAFTAVPSATSVAHLVAADGGGRPRPITDGEHNDHPVAWSRDGEWLYFASDRDGGWQLYRMMPEAPDAPPEQMTTEGGIAGQESPDGRYLYVSRPERAGLWRLTPGAGGSADAPLKVVDDAPTSGLHYHWDICRDGIVLARYGVNRSSFDIYRFESGLLETFIPEAPEISSIGVSVSPDCGSVLFGHVESGSADLMLVEGFR
jgi:Tol biopolymer transport system component/DNA-binding winged helix-turn-helix (wHTH) protein